MHLGSHACTAVAHSVDVRARYICLLGRCPLTTAPRPLMAFGSITLPAVLLPPATAGKQRRWDVVESHPSVGIVLYHRDLDAFILVRQFR